MPITYSCPRESCKSSDGKPVTREFKDETFMDERNTATLFCPRCHGPMVREGKPDNQAA